MAGSTPIYGFPYPESSDLVANYPALGQDLAEDIEGVISGLKIGMVPVTPSSIANSGGTASRTSITVTFSAVSSISLNGVFTSSFTHYRVVGEILGDATNRAIRCRFRAAGTDATGADYSVGGTRLRITGGSPVSWNESSQTYTVLSYVNETRGSISMDVIAPNTATFTRYHGLSSGSDESAGLGAIMGGYHALNTAYDGFTIYPNTGTFTGNLRVYGYAN